MKQQAPVIGGLYLTKLAASVGGMSSLCIDTICETRFLSTAYASESKLLSMKKALTKVPIRGLARCEFGCKIDAYPLRNIIQ